MNLMCLVLRHSVLRFEVYDARITVRSFNFWAHSGGLQCVATEQTNIVVCKLILRSKDVWRSVLRWQLCTL